MSQLMPLTVNPEQFPSSNVFLRSKQKRVSLPPENSLAGEDTPKNFRSPSRGKIDLKNGFGSTATPPKLPKTPFAQEVKKEESGKLKRPRLSTNLFVEKKNDTTKKTEREQESKIEALSRGSGESITTLHSAKGLFAKWRDGNPVPRDPDESKDNANFSLLPKSLFNAKTEEQMIASPATEEENKSSADQNLDEMEQPSSVLDLVAGLSKNLFAPRIQTTKVESESEDSTLAQNSGLRIPKHMFSPEKKMLPAPSSEEEDCNIDLYRCGRRKVWICRDDSKEMCVPINAFSDDDYFGCCAEDCAGPPKCQPRRPPRRYLRSSFAQQKILYIRKLQLQEQF